MIWTVTLNPAIDHVYLLRQGADPKACMAEASAHVPAGKGVNVSRALATLGTASTAVVLVSQDEAAQYEASLRCMPAEPRCLALLPFVRHHTTLLWQDGRPPLHVREPGPVAPPESLSATSAALAEARTGDDVAFCGSLPPGLSVDAYASLVARVQSLGGRAWLDTAGPALALGLEARPYAVKVNRQEAADVLSMDTASIAGASRAAVALLDRVQQFAVVTLGKDGLILASRSALVWARAQPQHLLNAVGSGDAAFAGLLSAWQAGESELAMARLAAVAASASLNSLIPAAFAPADLAFSLANSQATMQ